MTTTTINNTEYKTMFLRVALTNRLKAFVSEYIADQNCSPALWFNEMDLTSDEKAICIYNSINHTDYKYNKMGGILHSAQVVKEKPSAVPGLTFKKSVYGGGVNYQVYSDGISYYAVVVNFGN